MMYPAQTAGDERQEPIDEEDDVAQEKAYALGAGEGRTYDWHGYRFTIKAGKAETEGHLAFMEFTTRKGEEPPPHVHENEDEIFYVVEGALTFTCGDATLDIDRDSFVFLPRKVQHGYRINSDGPVRLLILTTPSHFAEAIERDGTPV